MKTDNELITEINSFNQIWNGGYRTGYSTKRNQIGVEKYLAANLDRSYNVFEIGCGGGQWTRFIAPLVNSIVCNDAKSYKDNYFFEYLHHYKINTNNITYNQALNFNLDYLQDNSLDFVFSYDVFCHISLSGQEQYLKNLYPKCKNGCKLMIMYADPNKYASSEPENIESTFGIYKNNEENPTIDTLTKRAIEDCDGENIPNGRWYFVGKENFLKLCNKYRYDIISDDLNIDQTNPITLFTKL